MRGRLSGTTARARRQVPGDGVMTFEAIMQRMGESLQAGRSFGPPIETDGCTVVPAAWVIGGGGGGLSEKQDVGSGFGYLSIPMGVYVIKDGDVRFKPAYDVGLLTMVGAGVFRSLRRARR